MSGTVPQGLTPAAVAELRDAVAAFEQILNRMPNDIPTLRSVFQAYDQLGDTDKAAEYLLWLGHVLTGAGDVELLAEILPSIRSYAGRGHAGLHDLAGFVESLLPETPGEVRRGEALPLTTAGTTELESPDVARVAADRSAPDVSHAFNMAAEMAFAWNLMESGDLTQEEYADVVHDLTEMRVTEGAECVSVLHVLEARTFKTLDRIVGRVSEECTAPLIALSCFDLQIDKDTMLPLDFMLRRGAILFDLIGDHALVAILNPYDQQLRADVQLLCGRTCHFFMALPADFDQALTRLSDVQSIVAPRNVV